MNKKIIFGIIFAIIILQGISAAHYIVGYVENAKDGTFANGHMVAMWNYENGNEDNLTDIVGPSGNSRTNNIYMIDCESLNTPCVVGDVLTLKIINDGDNYVSSEKNISVTGAGYDLVSNLSLNSPPNITSIIVEDNFNLPTNEIDLSPLNKTKIYCNATISDYEGEDSIISARAEFFYKTNSHVGDFDDNNFHYSNNSCVIDKLYGNSNEVWISCEFQLEYYSNAEIWNCFVEAEDNLSVKSNNSDETKVNALLAISVNSVNDFGELGNEEVSNEINMEVINYGNVPINLSLSGYAQTEGDGYAMNCSLGGNGFISVNYEKYNLTASTPGTLVLSEFENVYNNLTATPKVKAFNLNSRQNDLVNDAYAPTYWRIYVPQGVNGTCQGNIIFGAVQEEEN